VEIGTIVLAFIGLLLALTVHEAAHAWAAFRLGDPTAKLQGRLSLNPLVHIDPIGTVLLPLLALATGAPIGVTSCGSRWPARPATCCWPSSRVRCCARCR
jgi:Zn-dependent protease